MQHIDAGLPAYASVQEVAKANLSMVEINAAGFVAAITKWPLAATACKSPGAEQ